MPIEANERPIKTLTLSDDTAENILELPQDAAYRWIHGRVIFDLSNGANVPTLKENDILNYVKAIGIRRNGRLYKFRLPLHFMHVLETIKKGKAPYKKDPVTTANEDNYEAIADFTIDFARNILNDSDISALLQTKNLSNLELVVQTGNKGDIASANAPTINSAKIELEIREYFGDVNGLDINDDRDGVKMTDVIQVTEVHNLETGRTQFDKLAQNIDLVASAALLEQMLVVKDNGVLSDSRVTDVKYARVRPTAGFPKRDFVERSWNALNEKNVTGYALDSKLTGVVYINWVEKLGSLGLVTRSKSYDLLRLLTNGVNAAQDNIEIYTMYV